MGRCHWGVSDLTELLAALPDQLPAIFLIVLHRRWDRPSRLQSILSRACTLPVIIAAPGEKLAAGKVYIGEPAKHLTLAAGGIVELIDYENFTNGGRTIDLLFDSVAAQAGHRTIGVVLSGSLDDGSRGLAAIHAAGGLTMVLTPTKTGWQGMPENAISYDGPISVIGTPHAIARGIGAACMAQTFS